MNRRFRQRILGGIVCTVVLSGVLVGSALATGTGGGGSIGPNGHVGSLQIDRSSLQDVIAFAGAPDSVGSGRVGPPYYYPPFEALAYSCQDRYGPGRFWTGASGVWCRTVFYIDDRTHKLAAFFTGSARYRGPRGIHPGMSAGVAEHRVHKRVRPGCLIGFALGNNHTSAMLWVNVDGGHGNPSPNEVIVGGRIASLVLESTRHPVGLLFC